MKKILVTAVILGLAGGAYAAGPAQTPISCSTAVFKPDVAAYAAQAQPIEWVAIPGGSLKIGTETGAPGSNDAKPVHEIIPAFKMAKTAVTVEQYAMCLARGKCTEPRNSSDNPNCNWNIPHRQKYPVNCLEASQMEDYAKFAGGRLPTEAEWEYAAKSGGKDNKYPWGNDPVTPDKVVVDGPELGVNGSLNGTMPVCSKPAGNTEQGLCDMAGNVWQLLRDAYYEVVAVRTGGIGLSALDDGTGGERVMRGNSFAASDDEYLRTDFRGHIDSRSASSIYIGFRLAK
ncbi:MAG: SUMF1/EgtB/PvdO family nonheme iron enzyme [Elusimicrobiales bacterium]|jgi:serine/threonine-protein kinase